MRRLHEKYNVFLKAFWISMALVVATSLAACYTPGLPGVGSPGMLSDTEYTTTPITLDLVNYTQTKNSPNSPPANARSPQAEAGAYEYRLGIGDVIFIKFWESADLTFESSFALSNEQVGTAIRGDGTIYFPYVGTLKVDGMTLQEVQDALHERFEKFYKDPRFEVTILEFNSQQAHITGEVEKPGRIPIGQAPVFITEAIEKVGGVLDSGDLQNASLIRGDGSIEPIDLFALLNNGDASYNRILHGGDALHIPANHRNRVFVMGEVREQKALYIPPGQFSLMDALSEVGGLSLISAGADHVYVIRDAVTEEMLQGEAGNYKAQKVTPEIYNLDAQSVDALFLAEKFQMQPRDVVYISTASITQWSRIISQLIPNNVTGAVDSRVFQDL